MYLVSPFNRKARLILQGRKLVFNTLKEKISSSDKVAWFHAASLGEFEQGRPLIELFKEKYPDYKILLTFFSSSGYEIRKDYDKADIVLYLPCDTISNAKRFIKLSHPSYVFFIKYEFWYNFIIEAKQKGAKLYQVSLILRQKQYFFNPLSLWFRNQLRKFDYFFVQNKETKELLKGIGITNVKITGDTRFDRVFEIAKHSKDFEIVRQFCENSDIILMGSSWERDEEMMKKTISNMKEPFKLIIAPHKIDNSHIEYIESLFPNSIRYSSLEKGMNSDLLQIKVLIIDTIGILSSLYKYANIAYIGGGFGVGIHNILEAATFGKPIVFGVNYQKFQEAMDLIRKGGAFSIKNEKELAILLEKLLENKNYSEDISKISLNYIEENRGACEKILSEIRIY